MHRKFLIVMILLVGLSLGTTVFAQEAMEPWTCPESVTSLADDQKVLNFFTWPTYIDEEAIPNFESLCGVNVEVSNFDTNDSLLSAIRLDPASYDVIVPSDFILSLLISEELVAPLDKENIPNLANVIPSLLDAAYDPGNVYSVPYQWGTISIGYDAVRVGEILGEGTEITSWEQVFDYPERRVSWPDDGRIMIGIALLYLGYDPNTTNVDEINAAKDFLIEKGRTSVLTFAPDNGQDFLERGEADIAIEYMGDIFQIAARCAEAPSCDAEFTYVIPEEGTNIWVDNLAIPAEASNKVVAEAFIDYILDPQIGANISNYTSYASPNQASIDAGLIDAEALENPGIYPATEILEKLFFVNGYPNDPDVQQMYNDAWTEIKTGVGS